MKWNQSDIAKANRVERLKLINGITGVKPANLIGTQDQEGQTNVAIFSSVVHLGSDPALIGFVVRPSGEVPRHTLANILATESYTINHVPAHLVKNAHYTSAKFPREVSEFERCGLTPQYVPGITAPFVAESVIKMGLKLRSVIDIPINGTQLIVGEVVYLEIPDEVINDQGDIDLSVAKTAGISGLNRYYDLNAIGDFPYARVVDTPEF
ncbi:MAG: flavin oxidoreductase [Cryomorphaceae bacterium BACL21 MAG-121220-bin10]|jgi:flavin reductase (DIM6/NTAB) family NADH-FMN oxidoreductase RutF|nr:MAG: flavin oxidoreductase [Cryomorphaceae bacterium BACL21 MAG-121220-bin10]MDA0701146.1 flavin reductase family protein [Bacteroidota bacterium]MDB9783150.1 flavin reductase family protein [Winogradskyella sp.]